jgi:type IV pilus assembly protein PilE
MRIDPARPPRIRRRGLHMRLHEMGQLPRRMRGMTLVELLTVMVVMAVLTTIAVSSYRRYMVRANRTDGTAQLLRVQVAQEKFYLQNNSYTMELKANTGLGFGADTTPRGIYRITIAEPTGGTIETGYVATATALDGQATDDEQCQTLTINDRGVRGATPGPTDTCWR